MRHDPYPENVRLVGLPCLGRVSALHIVESARLGAAGVFLAGCAEERCQYRTGDASALEQVELAGELLEQAEMSIPLDLWHLCAVDRHTVGRRIRHFTAHVADPDGVPVDQPVASVAACEGGDGCGRPAH